MSSSQANPPRPLPLWLKAPASAFALWHLLAVGMLALAAPSGPWFVPKIGGPSEAEGPFFAKAIAINVSYPSYLEPLRMTHNYHFNSNKTQVPGAYFEVHLKNEVGAVVKTLKFPDDKASFAVRHRQETLARALASDQPPLARGTQKIAPANQGANKVEIWEKSASGMHHLKSVDESEAQERQAFRPSEFSKVLARSYMRYLCIEHKAASAELVRHTQEAPIPSYLFMPIPVPADAFNELKNHFGEYRRED